MFTKTEVTILLFIVFFAAAGGLVNIFAPPAKEAAPLKAVAKAFPVRPLAADTAVAGPQASQGRVDINRATVEELMALPGVGRKTAEAIIRARGLRGAFRSPSDLLEVKGIGKKKLEKMAAYIKI